MSVARYVLGPRLGQGPLTSVWAAREADLDREVALKIYEPIADDRLREQLHARLVREAQAIARLHAANVVPIYDVGEDGERLFIAMQRVRGSSIATWAAERPWRVVLAKLLEAGRGVAAAHAVGVVHRDLKPGNLLIDETGRVLVSDFGQGARASATTQRLATVTASDVESSWTLEEQRGPLRLAARYVAPEQHLGARVDERSDQFSFCMAAYELLYGSTPYRAHASGLPFAKVQGDVVVPMRRRIPRGLFLALRRGLSPHPGDRFASMEDLLAALQPASRGRQWPLVVLAAGVVGATAAYFWIT